MIGKFYMTRPEEIAKHAELCRLSGEAPQEHGSLTAFEAMAGGDPGLFDAMWSFWDFEHALDDLLDESAWNVDMVEAALKALYDEVLLALGFPGEQIMVSDWTRTWVALLNGSNWTHERQDLAHRAEQRFFEALQGNPLYRQNRGDFRALFAQCIFRAIDGEAMTRSGDERKMAMAPAVKCGDLEVLFHLVLLAHGWVRARLVSSLRDYDQPDGAINELMKEAN